MTPAPPLKAPFPYFGGKSRAAPLLWEAFGAPRNYVEPFFGSGAVLLQRPTVPSIETINDKCGFVANFWRAVQAAAAEVAAHADWPVNENDQHAVHRWLLTQRDTLVARLEGDPAYYDAQIAGRWVWGLSCWIGSGWCRGDGPWHSIDGQLVHLSDAGQGGHRQRVHLSDAGQGVHRQRVHLSDAGEQGLYAWFAALQARLRSVRVCCGDWTRVLGPSVTWRHGMTAVLLDPPYSAEEGRATDLYAEDDLRVAHAVRDWCLAHGQHPLLRIALCGYGDIHDALCTHGWRTVHWTANGGFGNQRRGARNPNNTRETIWLSPACLRITGEQQLTLFEEHA